MAPIKRICDNPKCKKEYEVREADLKRGWGKCCNKSCAAVVREMSKPGYDPKKVSYNNIRRKNWGKDSYARKRGFPDYESMIEIEMLDDPSWDAHGGIEIAICDICNLRADYCQCGEI